MTPLYRDERALPGEIDMSQKRQFCDPHLKAEHIAAPTKPAT
jgi:hypothetical protein